jgi:xylose isomerase
VKKAIEVTHRLGGSGYTFWGGREGYQCLWNTDMKREMDHLAAFMHMAVDYAKSIGFTGQFYFEPKPREPMKHQYDFDAATCINFLRTYGLEKHVKMNLETNHATLAGHEIQHELEYAGMQGFLGSVDANTGDTLVGWDTDQFPTNVSMTTQMMWTILKYGGLAPGGIKAAEVGRGALRLVVEPAGQADRGGHGVVCVARKGDARQGRRHALHERPPGALRKPGE